MRIGGGRIVVFARLGRLSNTYKAGKTDLTNRFDEPNTKIHGAPQLTCNFWRLKRLNPSPYHYTTSAKATAIPLLCHLMIEYVTLDIIRTRYSECYGIREIRQTNVRHCNFCASFGKVAASGSIRVQTVERNDSASRTQ